ncbi:MAG: Hsp20/alpha crystallin family protein [Sulfuritalea sp.]|nr:Hsp20/alpha crystallin family protein [Sulfuritalea sp.]
MYFHRSFFPGSIFAELERLQRGLEQTYDPSIRGGLRGGFPALNIGSTPQSVEIYAFAPGIDPAAIEVQIEKGVLTLAGERNLPAPPKQATLHIGERFSGRFRRVVSLPDDVEPDSATAKYRDGVLHISIARKESAVPRRISIQ